MITRCRPSCVLRPQTRHDTFRDELQHIRGRWLVESATLAERSNRNGHFGVRTSHRIANGDIVTGIRHPSATGCAQRARFHRTRLILFFEIAMARSIFALEAAASTERQLIRQRAIDGAADRERKRR